MCGAPAEILKARRERIAAAVLAGIVGGTGTWADGFAEAKSDAHWVLPRAIAWADALIAELDK